MTALLILAGIAITAADALWPAAVRPEKADSRRDYDADYVKGLTKLGIAKPARY
jgi:hypothetical protein